MYVHTYHNFEFQVLETICYMILLCDGTRKFIGNAHYHAIAYSDICWC